MTGCFRLLFLLMFLFSLSCRGETRGLKGNLDYDPFYRSSNRDVITTHTEWIKPNKKGSVKVLFITYSGGGGVREVKELAQRIELDYSIFTITNQNLFFGEDYGGETGALAELPPVTREMVENDLEEKLNDDYDLIVLGNTHWQTLPPAARLKILKKVKEGTNLLGYVRAADEYLNRATENKIKPEINFLFPYKGLPFFSPFPDFKTFIKNTLSVSSFGEGKIALLGGYEMPPAGQMLVPGPTEKSLLETKWIDYDYYLAYICHLILFAADKQPDLIISGREYIKEARENFTSMEFSLHSSEEKTISTLFTLRNKDNETFISFEKKVSLSSGNNSIVIDTGKVPAGKYFADLRLKEGDEIVNFGSSFVELTSDICIREINIQDSYRKDEGINGSVSFSAKESAENLRAEIILKDNFGRITGKEEIAIGIEQLQKQEFSFSLGPVAHLSVVQYLEARLLRGEEVIDVRRKIYFVSDMYPETDDIRFVIWDWMEGWSSFTYKLLWEELRKAGFDTAYLQFWNERYFRGNEIVPLTNMHIIPYSTRIVDSSVYGFGHSTKREHGDHVRKPCLTDPEYRKSLAETVTKIASWSDRFATIEYAMGDENHFAVSNPLQKNELCFSPTCVAFFHEFLRQEYGSIENLNKEYEFEYNSFGEVQPVTLEETEKNRRLIPLWVDFRRCMESNWAGIYEFCKDTVRKVTPEAKIGYEGSDRMINSFQAADFYKLMQVLSLNNTYFRPFTDYAVADFSQQGTLLGLGWYGGYAHAHSIPFNRYIPWRHLFRGANSLWVYTRGPGKGGSVIASDFSFYDYFQANIEEMREIKEGIGKLLISSKRDNDGIAVLYSASSVHSATLTPSLPSIAQVLDSLTSLLEDTRYQFKVISYQQLEEGILNTERFKVLLLPFVQSLSEKEAEEIMSFVENGGTVIADIRPGVSDEHGKPYNKGILDKVFGVEQSTVNPIVKKTGIIIKDADFPDKLPVTSVDASIKLTSAQARAFAEGTPSFIVKDYGKGRAILLNFSLSGYPNIYYSYTLRTPEEMRTAEALERGVSIRKFFRSLMYFAGIEEKAKISTEIPGLRMYGFNSGNLRYLGFLQELVEQPLDYVWGKVKPLTPTPVTISLPAKYHIYDIRKGEYMKFSDSINIYIEEAGAKLYALLPYRVKGIAVSVPDCLKQGDILEYEVSLETEQGIPEMHVFRISLISPQGKEISYYSKNFKAGEGKLVGKIPLSLNEYPGRWKIRIKDIASGVTSEKDFMVGKPDMR